MADFERMPAGTREAMEATARLLRAYERDHNDKAARAERDKRPHLVRERAAKAKRNGDAAERLEALLQQQRDG